MKNAMKKLMAFALVAVMLIGALPFAASAADGVSLRLETTDGEVIKTISLPNDVLYFDQTLNGAGTYDISGDQRQNIINGAKANVPQDPDYTYTFVSLTTESGKEVTQVYHNWTFVAKFTKTANTQSCVCGWSGLKSEQHSEHLAQTCAQCGASYPYRSQNPDNICLTCYAAPKPETKQLTVHVYVNNDTPYNKHITIGVGGIMLSEEYGLSIAGLPTGNWSVTKWCNAAGLDITGNKLDVNYDGNMAALYITGTETTTVTPPADQNQGTQNPPADQNQNQGTQNPPADQNQNQGTQNPPADQDQNQGGSSTPDFNNYAYAYIYVGNSNSGKGKQYLNGVSVGKVVKEFDNADTSKHYAFDYYTIDGINGKFYDDYDQIEPGQVARIYVKVTESKLNDNKVYLQIYLNNNFDTPAKTLNVTSMASEDGLYLYGNVEDLILDNYTAKNSKGIKMDGMYEAVGSWVSNFLEDDKVSRVSADEIIEAKEETFVVYNIMVTNAKTGSSSTADDTNPKTGDQIMVPVAIMAVSASVLAAVAFYLNKKRVY